MALLVGVYSATTPNLRIGFLTEDRARTWRDVLNDVGSWSLSVPRDSPDVALLVEHRWVKFELDGVAVFGGRVGPWRQATIVDGEEAAEDVVYSGPGGLAAFADAIVYHHLDTDELEKLSTVRTFNFAACDYTDWNTAAWGNAVEVWQQGSGLSPYGYDVPEGWPDPGAYWIWGTVDVPGGGGPDGTRQAIGDCYFRTTFSIGQADDVMIYITADDGYELWIDGVFIDGRTEAFMWRRVNQIPLHLDAGSHTVAIKGTNIARPVASTNGAGVLFAMYSVSAGGELNTLILHSDSTWKRLAYPAAPPGMTAGEILTSLIDEARARGSIAVWWYQFSDTVDSNGQGWDVEIEIAFQVGETYLDVLRKLAERYVDVEVDWEQVDLKVYVKGGIDDHPAVVLTVGVNITDLNHDGDPAYVTDVLMRKSDGSYVEVTSGEAASPGDGADPRIEEMMEASSAPSTLAATRMAEGVFDRYSVGKVRVTAGVHPVSGHSPYTNFNVGDTIIVPNRSLVNTAMQVLSMLVGELSPDQDGVEGGTQTYEIEGLQ